MAARPKPKPTGRPVAEPDNPFAVSPKRSATTNPFADAAESVDAGGPAETAEEATPFDLATPGQAGTLASRYTKPRNYTGWVITGLVLAAAGGAGAFFARDLFKQVVEAPKATGPIFENPGRNYRFQTPSAAWVQDQKRSQADRLDMSFHRADLGGYIDIVSNDRFSFVPSLAGLADELAKQWQSSLADIQDESADEATLAGQKARRLRAAGTDQYSLKAVQREAYILFHQGIAYYVTFSAPTESFASLADDFGVAREAFAIIGSRPGWEEFQGPPKAAFASKRFPYQLHANRDAWIENPSLETASRFSDLKLVDKAKEANIVVAPRETRDLEQLKSLYIRRQQRMFERADVKQPEETLTINGRQAKRIQAVVENGSEKLLLLTTFIQGDQHVFQVECRAPVSMAAEYTPLFTQIVSTFEVLDHVPAPEPAAVAASSTKDSKAKAPDSTEKPATQEAAAKQSDEPKVVAAKAKTSEPASKTVVAATPAPEKPAGEMTEKPATAKRRSLDDLDDMPVKAASKPAEPAKESKKEEATKPAEPKPAEPAKDAKKEEAKPAETKKPGESAPAKRKSLDDL